MMPKFNKPTPSKINTIWATNAITGDVTEIDTSKIQQGWVQEKPPYESENWINQQHDQYIAYINQLGVPEWDQYTEYQAGKSYVQGSNNLVYKCTQTHVNKNPATAGNETFWNVWEGNRQATTTARGTVELATDNETSQGQSTSLAVTPSSLLGGLLGGGFFSAEQFIGDIPFRDSLGNKKNLKIQLVRQNFTGLDTTGAGDPSSDFNHIHPDGDVTVVFPESFPVSCIAVLPVGEDVSGSFEGSEYTFGVVSKSKTQATFRAVRVDGGNVTSEQASVRYLAIGY